MRGDGPRAVPLSDPGFDHFFGDFWTMLTPPQRPVQTLKIFDFDPIYLKVQIPHFSENFRLKQKFWMGGGQPPPIVKLCHMMEKMTLKLNALRTFPKGILRKAAGFPVVRLLELSHAAALKNRE